MNELQPGRQLFTFSLPPEFYDEIDRRIKAAVDAALAASTATTTARYLTRKQVCQRLNISMPTLSRYISKGIVTAQKVGTRVLIDEGMLNESLQKLSK